MLSKIKLRLRISGDTFDSQLTDYIAECKHELSRQGVLNLQDDDPLVVSCCELYAKYKMNFDSEGEWYYKRFIALRDNMSTMAYYKTQPDTPDDPDIPDDPPADPDDPDDPPADQGGGDG